MASWQDIARTTHQDTEAGTTTFPQSVKTLMEAGFDGYAVDFRRSTCTYYMPGGESVELNMRWPATAVSEHFNAAAIKDAIHEAQALVAGYTYLGFCTKVAAAGCAGYLVSLVGKTVLYYGRSGETHTEYFPGTQPQNTIAAANPHGSDG